MDAALAAERADDDRQRQERVSELADALIAIDVRVVEALCAANDALCQRTRTAEEIVNLGAGMLNRMQVAMLRSEETPLDAIYDALSRFLGNQAPIGSVAKLISNDAAIFNKASPVPAPPMTAAERERRRSIENLVSRLRI